MTDKTKNYQRWIQCLTKDQFDNFIRKFIEKYFNVETVVITDTKGDGGIDAKMFEDSKNRKTPIQLTVDTNVYNKLKKDLVKISELINYHEYHDVFYFFYSKSAAEGKILPLPDIAWENYQIKLEIFDSKVLATYIDKPQYFELREILRDLTGDRIPEEATYFTKSDKLRFDFISFGDETAEIKNIVIESAILQLMAEGFDDTRKIEERVCKMYNLSESGQLISATLKKLDKAKKISFTNNTYTHVKLSEDVELKIHDIVKNSKLQESLFANSINQIINDYKLKSNQKDLIKNVVSMYKTSYQKHANEIRNNITNNGIESVALAKFAKFIEKISSKKEVHEISLELLKLCEENDFLQRICIGELFCSLIDCPEFDSYRRRNQKRTIIDTPVLLFLVCALYDSEIDYENPRYLIASRLKQYICSSQNYIKFMTFDTYITEVASHLYSAILLSPFSDYDFYSKLGGSGNIFYGFYLHLYKTGIFSDSFSDFLENEFNLSLNGLNNNQIEDYIFEYVNKLFKENNVAIKTIPSYEKDLNSLEDYKEIKKELETIYSNKKSFRSYRAARFDVYTLCYLYGIGDLNNNDGDLIDPTLLTWDNSFFNIRKRYHRLHPNANYWHIYRPAKFMDHLALINFKIDSNAITSEVMTLIEEYNGDIHSKIRSLNDILCKIVDLKTESGMKLTRGIAEMREKYIYKLAKTESKEAVDINFEKTQPIDKLLINLSDYYNSDKGNFKFDDFKKALTIDNLVDKFLIYISDEIVHYHQFQNFKSNYKNRMDKLIVSTKSDE